MQKKPKNTDRAARLDDDIFQKLEPMAERERRSVQNTVNYLLHLALKHYRFLQEVEKLEALGVDEDEFDDENFEALNEFDEAVIAARAPLVN